MEKKKKAWLETIIILATSIILALFIRTYILCPSIVNGDSMDPTLKDGQFGFHFIFNKNHLERFDIVIVNVDESDKHIVKRVIGLPHEEIAYIDNELYVNGELIEEDFLSDQAYTNDFNIVLAEDEYFLLGDNRDFSRDSRYYGPFKKEDIIANGFFVIYPFNEFGLK